jgi:hypothetical protein
VRNLRRMSGPLRGGSGAVSSLVPLVVFSLLAAVFITQSGATLADSSFQSPQSPVQTPAPEAPPTEAAPGPPEELPVVPPGESPVVPAEESPGVPPGEEPGEVTPPSAEPGASPGEEVLPGAPTPTLAAEEEGSSPVGGVSWAVLIDTCVVGLSSLWLCCGGLALVVFVLLMIASLVLRVT